MGTVEVTVTRVWQHQDILGIRQGNMACTSGETNLGTDKVS
jgi:hypothetical protein